MRVRYIPGPLGGTAAAPPSKSMAHRALLAAALADGQSYIQNLAWSQDIRATAGAVQAFGAQVDAAPAGAAVRGVLRPAAPAAPVNCAESGSTLRFLAPVLAMCGKPVQLVGRGRLLQRPQQIYAQLFAQKGAQFVQDAAGIRLCGPLPAGQYTVPGDVSSQFITGLLYALALAGAESRIHILPPLESRSYIDLTVQALADFGVQVRWESPLCLHLAAGQRFAARSYAVEGDYSNAAFLAVLGAVCGGITVQGLRPDSLQGDACILDILARCGAQFVREGSSVRFAKAPLHAAQIDLANCPDLGPVLMVLALFCTGTTYIYNAGRLRIKESDRIAAMQAELARFGGHVAEPQPGTLAITGTALHAPAAPVQPHGDHRVVMACAVAAMAAGLPAVFDGAEAVQKSWPEFFAVCQSLGAQMEVQDG